MAGDPRTVLIANPGADLYGSDRMTVESVRALVAGGYRVFVTVPGPGPLIDLLTDAGATVLEQPTPIIRKSLLSPRGLVQLVQETVQAWGPSWRLLKHTNAGTVMVNTITPPLWFPLARLAGLKAACHLHEAESTVVGPVRWAMYLPLQFANRVVANSTYTKRVLEMSSIGLAGRTVIVYNTVPGPAELVPCREELVRPVRLLYVGRLSARKGPQIVVQAMAALRARGLSTTLDVVGAVFPGNEGYEQELRALVASLDLQDEVRFHGFQRSVWPYRDSADLAVVPSIDDESFGNAAAESILAGRPAVVSEIAGLKEATAGCASVVLISPGNSDELAVAVEKIVADWPRYAASATDDARMLAERLSLQTYREALVEALALP